MTLLLACTLPVLADEPALKGTGIVTASDAADRKFVAPKITPSDVRPKRGTATAATTPGSDVNPTTTERQCEESIDPLEPECD